MVRLQPYNQDLIDEFRRKFFENYPSGNDAFDPRDIERVKKYDKYLYNILIISKSDVDVALGKLEKILTWRKENEINDLTWDSFSDEAKNVGPIYCRGHSKDNCRILWFRVKHSKKGNPEAKRFISFWLEKLQWEDFDNPVVVMQDFTGAGVSNMDLDVIKHLIGCLELYFPALCDMLYIFEMPWILNAIWKVIEKLLSEQSKAHLRFIKSKDVMNYFDADQLPVHMGGTDTYEWSYPPPEQFRDTEDDEEDEENGNNAEEEKMHSLLEFEGSVQEEQGDSENVAGTSGQNSVPSRSKEDGDALKAKENLPLKEENDVSIKKVHFADESQGGKENTDPSRSPTKRVKRKTAPAITKKQKTKEMHVGPLITIRPGESLVFRPSGNKNNPKELRSLLSLSNTTDGKVAFKIKTTSPDKYRVRPSAGQINPEASVGVEILFLGGESGQIVQDKFLVLSTEFGEETAKSTGDLVEFWRKVSRSTVVEHRLKCVNETPPEALIGNHDILKELQQLSKKVTATEKSREEKLIQMNRNLLIIVFMQFVLLCLVVYIYFTSSSTQVIQQSCLADH